MGLTEKDYQDGKFKHDCINNYININGLNTPIRGRNDQNRLKK